MFSDFAEIYKRVHDSVEAWNRQTDSSNNILEVAEKVVEILNDVPGMTQAHSRDFKRATPLFSLRDGSVIKTWKNPLGVEHVFIADGSGNMVFGGFVGWVHSEGLKPAIKRIRQEFT